MAPIIATGVLILAVMTLWSGAVSGLGIICGGSPGCYSTPEYSMVKLWDAIQNDHEPNRLYTARQLIACTDANICAFVENYNHPVRQATIALLMPALVEAPGCRNCGSAPLGFGDSRDILDGALTVTFVHSQYVCSRKPGTNMCV